MHVERRSIRVTTDEIQLKIEGANLTLAMPSGPNAAVTPLPVTNISRGGMFVKSEWFLTRGATFSFALNLPGEDVISGEGLVKWLRTAAMSPGQPSGFGVEIGGFVGDDEYRFHRFLENSLLNLKVADLMSDGIVTAQPTDSLKKAVLAMRRAKVGAIVIVGPEQDLLGILTERDILGIFGEEGIEGETVATHMTTNVTTVCSADATEVAYRILLKGRFRHLPVVDEGKTIAMLSARDLLPYWNELMDLHARRLRRDYERAMHLIVHDLRSPITVIQSLNSLLLEGGGDVADFMALDGPNAVGESCEKMLVMIEELLEVEDAKSPAVQLVQRMTNLGGLVQRAVERFKPQAQLKDIAIAAELAANIPEINIDPLRFSRVLDNLLSNAIKYSSGGCTVSVLLRSEGAHLKLTVADDGQGIPEDELPRLFKERGKASSRPTGGEQSSGFGLAIVKNIVEAHRGRISVSSHVGQGTAFDIYLPLAPAAA